MSAAITYWQEPSGFWVGHWNDDPDHDTQGHTLDELKEMLNDLRSSVTLMAIDEANNIEKDIIAGKRKGKTLDEMLLEIAAV